MLLVIALLVFFFLQRQRQKRQQPPSHNLTPFGAVELETSKSGRHKATAFGMVAAGKRARSRNPKWQELSTPPPLNAEENAELERRRRAVELQGQWMGAGRTAELQGHSHPRAELEALRANARNIHELGGQAILSEVRPVHYQR